MQMNPTVCVTELLTGSDSNVFDVRYGHELVAICHIRTSPAGGVSFNVQLTEEKK